MNIQSPSIISNLSDVSDRDVYLTQLLNQCQGQSIQLIEQETVAWVQELRDRAAAIVHLSALPTTRDEEWRFTDLSSLRQIKFNAVETFHQSLPDITPLTLPEAANSRLVFVNGVYAPELSVAQLPEGLVVTNLANLPLAHRSKVQDYLGKAEGAPEVFTSLNTAQLTDVAVVWVSKNLQVETPIHLLFICTAGKTPTISQPRTLVVAETGSSVTLIEEYTNRPVAENTEKEEEAVYFTNAVTEIWIAENASINHTRLERESQAAFHIGKTAITQARDSRYTCNAITLGAKLSRHNLEIYQTGEQTETTLNGLTMIGDRQLADTHSAIILNHPHSTTRQLHKCIAADRAHTVFNGRVFVAKAAQLTDAGQLNRNLLLSPKARIDTKPQLEIIADNVKCTHGATVSQLEDEALFYLQSRGINAIDAQNLLVNAFAAEIINSIPVPSLQKTLTTAVNRQTSN